MPDADAPDADAIVRLNKDDPPEDGTRKKENDTLVISRRRPRLRLFRLAISERMARPGRFELPTS